jgi:hypothetical protein
MPFCPTCKFEYKPGHNVCPDCGDELVASLSTGAAPAAEAPDGSWISVCQIGGGMNSTLAKGALDSNNIPSIVMSSSLDAASFSRLTAGMSQSSAEGNVLMVPREYRDQAVLILQAILGDEFQEIEIR